MLQLSADIMLVLYFILMPVSGEFSNCQAPSDMKCGPNEEYAPCRITCPPQFCNNSYTDYGICPSNATCEPGCNCIKDYLRNFEGICVFNEKCPPPPLIPPCGENEVGSLCKITCPPDTCDFDPKKQACKPGPCQPGCNCVENYLRDFSGKCIPKNLCPKTLPIPPECGENEVGRICKTTCPPDTCDFDPKKLACKPGPCQPGCNCIENYLRDFTGKCIPKKFCPKEPITCDRNASYIKCPSSCPPTCQAPNEISCRKQCDPYGCQCNPSYLLSNSNGQCILPKDCPGGYPCPQNETFVPCSLRCPNYYCPVDDSLAPLICDPPRPCPSGCTCKQNYKRKSVKDNRCILASECPPVKCTRPKEKWDPCPSPCRKENCYDNKTNKTDCEKSRSNCQPRCVCEDGYYRNETGICIPAAECFSPESCDIPYECRPTCAEPNPPNCSASTCNPPVKKNAPGCKCIPGSILLEKNGECVKIEDCPQQLGCNMDPNARITKYPAPCPSTCQSPKEIPCKKARLDVGCECKEGYILSKLLGKCISPNECPGGNPCGKNATFSSCNNGCPYNYCPVDDSRSDYSCSPPNPCPSGCVCKLNYRRKSINDKVCILASECPPVNCTRPNEIWSPCPSDCLKEGFEDSDQEPVPCNTFVLNCQPKCICKPNTFRDKNQICVPVDQCPKKIPQPECG